MMLLHCVILDKQIKKYLEDSLQEIMNETCVNFYKKRRIDKVFMKFKQHKSKCYYSNIK